MYMPPINGEFDFQFAHKTISSPPNNVKGSAKNKYTPTYHIDAVTGSQMSMISITAMEEYQKRSIEELRNEDYLESGGLFGSTVAKIGVELCAEPTLKQSPAAFGKLYRSAIAADNQCSMTTNVQAGKSLKYLHRRLHSNNKIN